MKPAIDRIGKVYERDGRIVLTDWTFRDLEPEKARVWLGPVDAIGGLILVGGDDEDGWSVDELRQIAEQEAVLTLLPTAGEAR